MRAGNRFGGLVAVTGFALAMGVGYAPTAWAQAPAEGRATLSPSLPREAQTRDEIREATRQILEKYPPSLAAVLRLDPTLLTNEAYLQPYAELRAFLATYPEVIRSPQYFLPASAREERAELTANELQRMHISNVLEMISVGFVMSGMGFVLIWLVRHLLAHRRWLRSSKLQMEIHNRLMERLQSGEDVKRYLESTNTARFLSEAPSLSANGAASSPAGRILLAVQVGLVLCCTGVGVLLTRRLIGATEAASDTLVFFGVIGVAIGVGFALSAAASFVLSRRFGLLTEPTSPSEPGRS